MVFIDIWKPSIHVHVYLYSFLNIDLSQLVAVRDSQKKGSYLCTCTLVSQDTFALHKN